MFLEWQCFELLRINDDIILELTKWHNTESLISSRFVVEKKKSRKKWGGSKIEINPISVKWNS